MNTMPTNTAKAYVCHVSPSNSTRVQPKPIRKWTSPLNENRLPRSKSALASPSTSMSKSPKNTEITN